MAIEDLLKEEFKLDYSCELNCNSEKKVQDAMDVQVNAIFRLVK